MDKSHFFRKFMLSLRYKSINASANFIYNVFSNESMHKLKLMEGSNYFQDFKIIKWKQIGEEIIVI